MVDTRMWSAWSKLAELWWERHGGLAPGGLGAHRFAQLVRYAREYSPFYRRLYDGFPDDVPLEALPVVRKSELMAHFDEWCTDPRVRLRDVRAFLGDRRRVGEPFLEGLWAWKSSGTSGVPGIYMQDAHAIGVYDALLAMQLEEVPWGAQAMARLLAGGGRAALIVATGDHFASAASWERMRRALPSLDARIFAVTAPLPQLVRDLDDCRPAFIAGYPSVLELLAAEQQAGRLDIAPAVAWCGGEALAPAARARIEKAFGCGIMSEYGASECLSIAHECREGWQHLHSEWVMLEAVDRDGMPARPGELSHTALLTNLANWVQPLIRYDLGDRIVQSPAPCRCGSRLPAFRVEGRTDDMLSLRNARGEVVRILPLAISTVVEEAAGEHRFQVAQTGPRSLALRIAPAGHGGLATARRNAARALRDWLASQSLPEVRVSIETGPPRADLPSGKLRNVIGPR